AVELMAMMGVLFSMPQFFQGVSGTDAMGSGLRLLPLVGGVVLGALPADRVVHAFGAKLTAAAGFAALAAGLALGSATSVSSSTGFVAAWMAVVGAGMGLSLATASSAALSELTPEDSGIGSAVLQAVNKTGGPLGTAVLGSVLSSVYLAQLHLSGLPAAAASAVKQSIFGAVTIAGRLHSAALLHTSRVAFTHGMDRSLLVSAGIAVIGSLLALLFLPVRARQPEPGRGTSAGGDVVLTT
ncbi:MAG: MFS transporter, partial [Solirubrobacteraceae bacterium]